MKYRAEIDGLRALAVVPVILFHAGFELFSGGFVGVDVFFVISGYLITTILIEDIENKRFSIANFYERRARRLLPALFFVMLVCIPFAWMWMLPTQMKDFSQSLVAVSLFGSNIFFWKKESGYFAAAVEEKPLLHTWSLAVEEQYYVLFPIFLILAWRFGKNRVFWMIAVMAAISLLLSEWGWRNQATANFYLAPTRAWELFAGSIAAFVVQKRGIQKNNLLALVGLVAIIFSIFFYDETTPFPSVYALVPVVGVVLLVLYADKETLVARLLSTKGFVGIGLISYSAYLWHQPLFAFARIRSLEHPSLLLMSALSLFSLVLAYFSWRYIENPFRGREKFSRRAILIISLFGLFGFSASGFFGHIKDGLLQRYSIEQQVLIESAKSNPLRPKCHFSQVNDSLDREACEYFFDNPSIAVMGNSHGTELAYAIADELRKSSKGILHHTMSACRHNYKKTGDKQIICMRWHEKVLHDLTNQDSIKTVVVSYRNELYIDNEEYRRSLVRTIEQLSNADKKVILVLQAPLPGKHIYKYIQQSIRDDVPDVKGLDEAEWNSIYKGYALLAEEIPSSTILVNPADLLCDSSGCDVIKNKTALYFDDDHLSIAGANIIANHIIKTYLLK